MRTQKKKTGLSFELSHEFELNTQTQDSLKMSYSTQTQNQNSPKMSHQLKIKTQSSLTR
jgi:hypothetical protein